MKRRRRGPAGARGTAGALARGARIVVLAAAAGCSSEDRTLTVEITVGHETDALRRTPAVTRVEVTATDGVGAVARASAAPGGTFDLGDRTSEDIVSIEATGFDGAGVAIVRGRSLSGIGLGGVASDVLPVFVQRKGEWARPSGAIDHAHVAGVAGAIGERYVLLTGGIQALPASASVGLRSVAAYDLLGRAGATMAPFPRAARSLVALASSVVVIDDQGATRVDLTAGSTEDLAVPTGLGAFAEVAGGVTLPGLDGSQYVVGATRAGAPTRAVLRVGADGTQTGLLLGTARAGAAASYLADVGLVVAGGSATGPGVEILSTGGTAFAATAFPADPTTGAAIGPASKGSFAVVGGTIGGKPAPTRTFALDCGATCAGAGVDAASIPFATARTAAFSLGGLRIVVVADEATVGGTTRAFLVDLGARTQVELPLREPRAGATAVPAPNGTLALLGGVHPDGTPALTVEVLFPE